MVNEVDRWQVGQVRITRVVETEMAGLPPSAVFRDLDEDDVRQRSWLVPAYAGADGSLRLSHHAFVIESLGKTIIVDTCVGNDKARSAENFNQLDTPFLGRLAEAGYLPELIDYVLCTHMHVDHVGWNTRWDGVRWVPTFPNARYLFGRIEWEHFRQEAVAMGDVTSPVAAMLDVEAVIADSIRPIIDRDLADFVQTDHRLTDDVSLFATPGHTQGHVSVRILSEGQEAVISGDVLHHPIQIADSAICASVDMDSDLAEATRRTLLERIAGNEVILLGTHFTAPSGGKVVRDQGGWLLEPCCTIVGPAGPG